MGCFYSKERNTGTPRCHRCNYKIVINASERLCYWCSEAALRPAPTKNRTEKPCFGEFRCKACSRYWTSRLCWPRKYQACKRCGKPVYPFNWRELTPAHKTNVMNHKYQREHERKLCQKCQEVGHYCGNYV